MKNRLIKPILLIITGIACLFFAMPTVFADVDKTALISERNNIQSILNDHDLYFAESYEAFEADLTAIGGIAYVDSVIADELATQIMIDDLTNQLIQLQNQLITHLLHAQMDLLYAAAKATPHPESTLRSLVLYNDELDRIGDILNDPRAGDEAIAVLDTDLTNALDLLILLGDRTNLISSYQEVQTLALSDGTDYTPNSFSLFLSAYSAFTLTDIDGYSMTVDEIANFSDASVDEVAAAEAEISVALSLLIDRPDLTLLSSQYQTADSKDLSPYTPNSITEYEVTLAEVLSVINNPNSEQSDVDQALALLSTIDNQLVLLADKADLIYSNKAASIAYYEERNRYTETSHELFRQAVLSYGAYQTVQLLIDDPNATQASVDAMTLTIVSAIDLLVFRADTTLFETFLDELDSIDLSPYTPNSTALFITEKERLEAIASSQNIDDDMLAIAWVDYHSITSLLVELTDKSSLINLIDEHRDTIEKGRHYYTQTSYGFLQIVLSEAASVLNDPNVTLQDVVDVETKFLLAIDLLEYPFKEIVITEDKDSINLQNYVVIGDSSISEYVVEDPSIITVSELGIMQGHNYGRTTVRIVLENGLYEEVSVVVKAKLTLATFLVVLSIPVVSISLTGILLSKNTKDVKIIKKPIKKQK